MSMIRLRMKLRRDKSAVAKAMADRLGYCKKPIMTLILRNTEKMQ